MRQQIDLAALLRLPIRRRQLEGGEFETRHHRAADQRPVAARDRRLPGVRRNDALRALAGREIAAEHDALAAARRRNFELERRARVPMPDLDRVDAMPVRTLAARQQKIDRGGRRTGDADAALPRERGRQRERDIAKGLPVMPAFRMRLQIQDPDHIGGSEHDQSTPRCVKTVMPAPGADIHVLKRHGQTKDVDGTRRAMTPAWLYITTSI